jgi:hypothetical protein
VRKTPREPKPQPMVSWLAPRVLLHSAQEVVLSGLFANFADKRETMAGLDPGCFSYGDENGEFWLDYASDVGDGFDSTHTIARLLAAETLTVGKETTQRGRVLVLGGDQVYPSASWERYRERFRLPYELALPTGPGPDMFAVPGNHDWYDGLTSFMRVFCQSGRVGGWTTRQRRSYFALELPRDWWLFGIDIQFDAYVDGPQIEYFKRVMADNGIGQGHKIILATAKPSWVHVDDPEHPPVSWNSLAYFDEAVICPPGAQLAVTITGDLHHYSNYSSLKDGAGPKITAGGGGAYLSPTHPLPTNRSLPPVEGSDAPATEYVLGAVFPDAATSKALAGKILGHLSPHRTPTLGVVLAVVYGLVALLLAAGVKDQATNFASSMNGFGELFLDSLTLWMVLLVVVLGLGLRGWARSGDAPGWAGVLHALAQLALAWAATLALLEWNALHAADDGFWLGYEVAVLVAVVGALGGRAILVLYLWLAHRHDVRWHANEVLAAQGIAGYKNFLRFKIDAQGDLTMYAIGVERVPEWTIVDGKSRLVAGGEFVPEAYAHLIEKISV